MADRNVYVDTISANVCAEHPEVKFDFITPIISILIPMLLDWFKGCGGTPTDVAPKLKELNDGYGSYPRYVMAGAMARARQACRRAGHREYCGDRELIESMALNALQAAEEAPSADVAAFMPAGK